MAENRHNARNTPPLSSNLFAYTTEHKRVNIMQQRIGLADMDMDLNESRGKGRKYLPGGFFYALNPGLGKEGTAI